MGLGRVLLLALGICCWCNVAMAQVTMEVHLGLQGTVRLEKWNAVTVQLHNAGSPMVGTLVVRIWRGSELRHDFHSMAFTRPVELPAGARKRLTFAVPITSITHPVEVVLRTDMAVVATQRLHVRDALNAEHIIVGMTRDLSLDFLATTVQHTRVAYLAPGELPQHWSGYDSVTAVVAKGAAFHMLTDEHLSALQQWLARGGTLIVAGDAQYTLLQDARLQSLLPVQVLGLQHVDDVSAFSIRYGAPLPPVPCTVVAARVLQGQLLVGTPDTPFLVQRSFGRGRVVFLAVDYATQPFAGWAGTAALWREMLQLGEAVDPQRVFTELGLLDDAHPIMKLFGRPVLAYPSHLALGLFLLVYCSSLGAVFWRMSQRRTPSRRLWSVVAVLVLGFTVAAYRRFAEPGLRQPALLFDLATMEILSDTGYSHTQGYVGAFSAPGGRFDLPLQPADTVLRHTFTRGVGKVGHALAMTTVRPQQIQDITLAPWTLRVFTLESLAPTPLRISVRRHTVGLAIHVENRGTLPFQGALVAYQGKVFVLGTIAPGEAVVEDLYPTLQATESAQETTWRVLLKRRPAGPDERAAYLQEVLLQQSFGDTRFVDASAVPFVSGWLMAPTTLAQVAGGLPAWGMTLVTSRLAL